MKVIPAIDIIGGKCVRLTEGDYGKQTTYHDDPLEVATEFESAGLKNLHLVDLDGAKAKKIINRDVLTSICQNTNLHVDFGGGVKDDEQIQHAFDSGVHQVTGGSVAATDRETFIRWLEKYGSGKIILGADVRDEKILVNGWKSTTELKLLDYLEFYRSKGVVYVICTDVSRDGMLQGPSLALYKKVLDRFPELRLIASGGVTSEADLAQLEADGLYGAIVGKAFYEGKLSLKEMSKYAD